MLAQQFPWVKQMKIFWHIEQKGILKITAIYIRVEKESTQNFYSVKCSRKQHNKNSKILKEIAEAK